MAACHGIAGLSPFDVARWGEFWRFTTLSARRLFEEVFPSDHVEVKAYGNVLTAVVAFLHGLAAAELTEQELEYHPPYPCQNCCRSFSKVN